MEPLIKSGLSFSSLIKSGLSFSRDKIFRFKTQIAENSPLFSKFAPKVGALATQKLVVLASKKQVMT